MRPLLLALTMILSPLAAGCGKTSEPTPTPTAASEAALAPKDLTAVELWAWATFPPQGGEAPKRFTLTAEELKAFAAVAPDLTKAEAHDCDCGVPPFGVKLVYGAGQEAEGHFFHGPDELTVVLPGGKPARLKGTRAMHDQLQALVGARLATAR